MKKRRTVTCSVCGGPVGVCGHERLKTQEEMEAMLHPVQDEMVAPVHFAAWARDPKRFLQEVTEAVRRRDSAIEARLRSKLDEAQVELCRLRAELGKRIPKPSPAERDIDIDDGC